MGEPPPGGWAGQGTSWTATEAREKGSRAPDPLHSPQGSAHSAPFHFSGVDTAGQQESVSLARRRPQGTLGSQTPASLLWEAVRSKVSRSEPLRHPTPPAPAKSFQGPSSNPGSERQGDPGHSFPPPQTPVFSPGWWNQLCHIYRTLISMSLGD